SSCAKIHKRWNGHFSSTGCNLRPAVITQVNGGIPDKTVGQPLKEQFPIDIQLVTDVDPRMCRQSHFGCEPRLLLLCQIELIEVGLSTQAYCFRNPYINLTFQSDDLAG